MEAIKRTLNFIFSHPLAKRNKLLAVYKFLTWQIQSRLDSGFIVVPFLKNTKVLAKKGLTGITGNIYTGLHEFEDMAFLLHFLRKEDIFFDVGANVGSYSILASGECGAQTIAFEPIPDTYSVLQKNVELNNLSQLLKAENLGVGSSEGTLRFTHKEDTTNHILAEDEIGTDSVVVPIVTLDSYFPAYIPSLMKIDVEGFETEVLKGASNILHSPILKAIIIELNGSGGRYGFNETEIHENLVKLAFKPYYYEPFSRELTEKETFGLLNTIYIRDIESVLERLKGAPNFEVFNERI